MNPTVARGGSSFRGAFLYYMHDKNASTRERVAWTQSVNMLTADPDRAWKVMAYTARHQARLKAASGQKMTGRKAEKPVLAYSLSWHPEQKPDPDHMRETALQSLKALGLQEHEAMIIAHSDTAHRHVHVVANRIHPITGKVASDSYTWLKLSDFALTYARAHGMNYSPQREANKRKREEGIAVRYHDSEIAAAWAASTDGKSLVAALEARGFILAQGNKRLVVVDQYGKAHNPARHIEGVRAKELKGRLAGIDLAALPDATALSRERAAAHEASKNADQRPQQQPAPKSEPTAPRLAPAFDDRAAPQATPAPAMDRREAPAQPSQLPPDKTPTQAPTPTPQPDRPDMAAIRLERLKFKHGKEEIELAGEFAARLDREKAEMIKSLRLREQRDALTKLRQKCEAPALWRRLFGLAKRDRRELATRERHYAECKDRYAARVRALKNQHSQTVELLRVTQQKEREFAIRVKNPRINEPVRARSPENQRIRNRGKDMGFER